MRERNCQKPKCSQFEYISMDATHMTYEDNKFDLTIDKGTYDALACDPTDKTMISNLFKEMVRVTKVGGSVIIITNGTPAKRMADFEQFGEGLAVSITHHEIQLSNLSQMINIMRSKYGDKPLSHIVKEPEMLKYALT